MISANRIWSNVVVAVVVTCGACTPALRPVAPVIPVNTRPSFQDSLVNALPQQAGLTTTLNREIDSIVSVGIGEGAAPGATVAVGRYGRLVHLAAYGRMAHTDSSAVTVSTIYDMASLTKVIATSTAAMILEEEGKLDLNRTVASYLPEFNAPDKSGITIRMLLTHRGGLEAFAPLYRTFRGRDQYLQQINTRPLKYVPGTQAIYSDWEMMLMQFVIERITGTTLDKFVAARVFAPLGMASTMFNPDSTLLGRIAPTEFDSTRGGVVRGLVHDENAWALGGVSGHAGLFSTAPDLAIFAQMLLNGGTYKGIRILKPSTISRWTARQDPGSSRALGWDTPSGQSSAGHYFAARSFGHTGFTGTSIWIDPERNLFVILLTNRVNETRQNNRHVPLRRDVADAVQRSITDAPLIDWEVRQ
ncbi:MAG: serine hydrolase [Gemmatimonadaceae bacterium]|nr:serine hydrolase [Gemmatimonadaceae bacterium]